MGIFDSIGSAVSSAVHTVKEAVGLEEAAPPPPAPAPAEPPPASPATAQSAADAANAHANNPAAVALQAQVSATAANPVGVASADGATYRPTGPKVPDDKKLPKDGAAILGDFTQMNGPEGGGERCGAATIVAAAVQAKGALGASELAANLAKDPNCLPDLKKEYGAIAQRLKGGDATFGDLGKLSAAIHKQYASSDSAADGTPIPGTSAIDGGDMSKLMKTKPIAATPDTRTWQGGTSWPMKLNIQNNGADGNHWVLMTKDKGGKFQAWDPMPRDGASQVADGERYNARMAQQMQASTSPSGFGFPKY